MNKEHILERFKECKNAAFFLYGFYCGSGKSLEGAPISAPFLAFENMEKDINEMIDLIERRNIKEDKHEGTKSIIQSQT